MDHRRTTLDQLRPGVTPTTAVMLTTRFFLANGMK
jgi:hypothetical protein